MKKRPVLEKSCSTFDSLRQEHKTLLDLYNKIRLEKYPNIQIQQSTSNITQPHYEIPPTGILSSASVRKTSKDNGSNASGFDDDFVSVFGTNTSENFVKQNIPNEENRNNRDGMIVAHLLFIVFSENTCNEFYHQKPHSSMSRENSITATQQDTAHILLSATTAGLKTVKYKALYEFNARSSDELSLQPGDIILVFEGYQSEPGWLGDSYLCIFLIFILLAGQIRDKVGWFPAAFAESTSVQLPTSAVLKKGNSLTGSPSTEPLAIIQEEGSEFTSIGTTAVEKQNVPFTADFSSG